MSYMYSWFVVGRNEDLLKVDGDIEAGKKLPLADIGSGVYPTTIFFNHSCVVCSENFIKV